MIDDRTQLRLRSALDSWLWLLVGILVVAVLVGSWGVYAAHVDPGTEREVQSIEVWGVEGASNHQATIVQENPVFENGTVLTDRSSYFAELSPEFETTYAVTYRSERDQPGTVTLSPSVVIEASDEETVYWRDVTSVGETVTSDLNPGESTRTTVKLNVTDLENRRATITDAVGTTPGEITTALVIDVDAYTETENGTSSASYTAQIPISTGGDVYQIGDPTESEAAVTRELVTERQATAGPLLGIGGPLLALLSLVLLGGILEGYRRNAFELSTGERDRLTFLTERNEFDEWIVRAKLPPTTAEGATTEAESLTDLVDFAIDSGVAVIEDTDSGQYYAIAAEQVLRYEPPSGVSIQDSSNSEN